MSMAVAYRYCGVGDWPSDQVADCGGVIHGKAQFVGTIGGTSTRIRAPLVGDGGRSLSASVVAVGRDQNGQECEGMGYVFHNMFG